VRILALTSGGDAWVPGSSDPSVADAASETAKRLQVFIRRIETGPNLMEQLQAAQDEKQVTLLIADAGEPPDETVIAVNELPLSNIALLLVDAAAPTVGADSWLARMTAGAFARARDAGLMRVASAGEMRQQMERLVDEARRKLMSISPAVKAEDARLARQALTNGITIDQQPNLAGPGADT
jgi:hypothetical protein